MEKIIIKNSMDYEFRCAFIEYFREFGFNISVSDGLFLEMSKSRDHIIVLKDNNMIVAFIMIKIEQLTNWFFVENVLFIRELWVMKSYRKQGIATTLIKEACQYAAHEQIFKLLLTTDTAETLYLKNGFVADSSYKAKNEYQVYVKTINKLD